MLNLSATIITLNEEKNLAQCLESLKGLVDEIILVDSGSSDKTIEIAKMYGAKIYHRKFDNFANQKNFALEKASGRWVLSIDADENIPEELAQEIRQVLETNQFSGFLIPRRNFILGGEIKHSRWSPDAHIWLWRKDKGTWKGEVHEEVVVEGKVGRLKNAKIHLQGGSIGEFARSNDLYSSLMAKSLFEKGTKFSFFKMIWEPILELGIRVVRRGAFLDGWRGIVLSILVAKYKFDIWLKLYKLYSQK